MSWKVTAFAKKSVIEAALARHEELLGWDEEIVLAGFEVAPDQPDDWRLDAYLAAKPTAVQTEAILSLFAKHKPELKAEKLPDADWVSESQKGIEPIRAGRFYVHTPDYEPLRESGVTNFCIPAAQAFGTGQHETTAGCLLMLDDMASEGITPDTIADIGTGTGLLAFGAMDLWPSAYASASDIDPLCLPAVEYNCGLNAVPLGADRGQLMMVIADGMEDETLTSRAPYDLLIANILAGPLIELAPDFAGAVSPGGSVVLAGLLSTQEEGVIKAYAAENYILRQRIINGDWSILWLQHDH